MSFRKWSAWQTIFELFMLLVAGPLAILKRARKVGLGYQARCVTLALVRKGRWAGRTGRFLDVARLVAGNVVFFVM